MDDNGRIRSEIVRLKAIRNEVLALARERRADAERFRRERDRPSNPTRAWEHQRECDEKAARALRDAESSERNAERLLNEIGGLESHLR